MGTDSGTDLSRELPRAMGSGDSDRIVETVANLSNEERELLEVQLGTEAVARMQRHARRRRGKPQGRVVVTHGITGSELGSIDESGDADKIWVDFFRLAAGRLSELKMDANGQTKKSVRIFGMRVEYLPLIVELSTQWDVLPFAYDWRENIDKSAASLNDAIASWSHGAPSHIVAHSMGGLVARRFIQKYEQSWAAMEDKLGGGTGGRLIMLGTPNHGSFAITQMLTGAERLLKWLDVIDIPHSMLGILKTIDSFHGSYQMLPSPLLSFGDDRTKLATKDNWGKWPVTQALIDQGLQFQRSIATAIDPSRMVYVAGFNRKTPYRIKVDNGKFSYKETLDGDGRVPHELGLLTGVPTFWIDEVHGHLQRNGALLGSIHEILKVGKSASLQTRKPRTRTLTAADQERHSGEELSELSESQKMLAQTLVPRRGSKDSRPDERIAAIVEAQVLADYLGGAPTKRLGNHQSEGQPDHHGEKNAPLRTVHVEVYCGDIAQAPADVLAAGHYMGGEPQNAEWALDCAVSGLRTDAEKRAGGPLLITQLERRGAIRGDLGDVYFFPMPHSTGKRRVVAIAGMGNIGRFGRQQLVRLSESLTATVTSIPRVKSLGTVLIGAGAGGLHTSVAVPALLEGICQALSVESSASKISKVLIIEQLYGKALEIQEALGLFASLAGDRKQPVRLEKGTEPTIGMGAKLGREYAMALSLTGLIRASNQPHSAAGRKAVGTFVESLGLRRPFQREIERELALAPSMLDGEKSRNDHFRMANLLNVSMKLRSTREDDGVPIRFSIAWDGTNIVVSALTDVAVVPERASGVDKALVDEAVLEMIDPAPERIQELGATMNRLLFHRDFREVLREASGPIVFEVDRAMAKVHWEMVAQDGSRGTTSEPIGLTLQVARQLRTEYSGAPSVDVRQPKQLRALVVGDPGDPEKQEDLPGARREAKEVASTLRALGVDVELMVGAPGSKREQMDGVDVPYASRLEVLGHLMRGGFDILHYCGHGDFNASEPTQRSGWLFKDGLLTAREMDRVDLAPRLVVANACLSAVLSDSLSGSQTTSRRDADLLPGLADEFFRRGVRNYIGTAWEVDDVGAIAFANELYRALLGEHKSLGIAMLSARRKLREAKSQFGALWAAYQHYGSPGFQLVHPIVEQSQASAHQTRRTTVKLKARTMKRGPAKAK